MNTQSKRPEQIISEESQSLTPRETIPLLVNGWHSQQLKDGKRFSTRNTCAFDSILAVYLCAYAENAEIRRQLINYTCDFASMIVKVMKMSKVDPQIYEIRNNMLCDMFFVNYYPDQWERTRNELKLNCEYDIGSTFARLVERNIDFRSAICTYKCEKCNFTNEKSEALVEIDLGTFNLSSIDQSIKKPRNKKCETCDETLLSSKMYENIIAFETESPKLNKLSDIKQSFTLRNKKYKFFAAIEYQGAHFTTHIKHKNIWKTYDDLQTELKVLKDINQLKNIFMVFYLNVALN